jgi:hypothetical protein
MSRRCVENVSTGVSPPRASSGPVGSVQAKTELLAVDFATAWCVVWSSSYNDRITERATGDLEFDVRQDREVSPKARAVSVLPCNSGAINNTRSYTSTSSYAFIAPTAEWVLRGPGARF